MLLTAYLLMGVILILFAIALFLPKTYTVTRSIVIGKPVNDVFNYIRYLKNQDDYNTWIMMDPSMKKTFTGVDGTNGFIYAWDGNKKAGAGEQEIVKIDLGKRIDMQVRFLRPFKTVASSYLTTTAVDNIKKSSESCIVEYGLQNTLKYPMNLMLLFMNMDKLLGKDMAASLSNLQYLMESKGAVNSLKEPAIPSTN